jgi:hypothetical protein
MYDTVRIATPCDVDVMFWVNRPYIMWQNSGCPFSGILQSNRFWAAWFETRCERVTLGVSDSFMWKIAARTWKSHLVSCQILFRVNRPFDLTSWPLELRNAEDVIKSITIENLVASRKIRVSCKCPFKNCLLGTLTYKSNCDDTAP